MKHLIIEIHAFGKSETELKAFAIKLIRQLAGREKDSVIVAAMVADAYDCRELAASFLPEADRRVCEFCGCLTNAKLRRCCRKGMAADSQCVTDPTPLFDYPGSVQ